MAFRSAQRRSITAPPLSTSSPSTSPAHSPPPSPPTPVDITMRPRYTPSTNRRLFVRRPRMRTPRSHRTVPHEPDTRLRPAALLAAALCLLMSVLAFQVVRALHADVSRKTRARAADVRDEAAGCAAEAAANACDVRARPAPPAVEALCRGWERCVARGLDAELDALSAVFWAEALAELVVGFSGAVGNWQQAMIGLCAAGVVLALCFTAVGRVLEMAAGGSGRTKAYCSPRCERRAESRESEDDWEEVEPGVIAEAPQMMGIGNLRQLLGAHVPCVDTPERSRSFGARVENLLPLTPKRPPSFSVSKQRPLSLRR